jgi:hypothetical protein
MLDDILDTVERIAGPEATEMVASAMEEVSDWAASLYNGIKGMFGFDTGGYTGAWGSGGKLAMLHEKELVLNKHDTENLLLTIDTLRGILSTIDSYALNQ